jgi:hypothetical protein
VPVRLRELVRTWAERAGTRGTLAHRVVEIAVGAVVVLGLIALNELLFRQLFDSNYLRWYLSNGALIGVAFVFITVAWGDLNKLTFLISAHPLQYIATCIALETLPGVGYGAALRYDWRAVRRRRRLKRDVLETARRLEHGSPQAKALRERFEESVAYAGEGEVIPFTLGVVEVWLGMLFAAAFLLAYVAWLLVIAPLQFFVNLVAGVPARLALASDQRGWCLIDAGWIECDASPKTKQLPEGAVESALSTVPVTFTAAVASGLLFAASRLVG